jgi:hypothetical protein
MNKIVGISPSVVIGVEKILYDRKSAAYALSISVRAVDYALARGEFETRKFGRKRLITAGSLKRYAARNHFGPATNSDQKQSAA